MHKTDSAVQGLQLSSTAAYFDLSRKEERRRSVKALRSLFVDMQQALQPDVVLEIGAREASFSKSVKRALPDTTVIAFEANPYNFSEHSGTVAGTGVEYLHLAISDSEGDITFFVQSSKDGAAVKNTVGSNSILKRASDGIVYEEVRVPSTTVDAFLSARKLEGKLTAWVDVEGAAMSVLAGATKSIDCLSALMIEVEDVQKWRGQTTATEILSWLRSRGFLTVARDFEYPQQYNVVLLKSEIMDQQEIRALLTEYFSSIGSVRRQRGSWFRWFSPRR